MPLLVSFLFQIFLEMRMNHSDSLVYHFSIETPFKQVLNLVLKRSPLTILYVIPFILNADPYIVITVLIIIFLWKYLDLKHLETHSSKIA